MIPNRTLNMTLNTIPNRTFNMTHNTTLNKAPAAKRTRNRDLFTVLLLHLFVVCDTLF